MGEYEKAMRQTPVVEIEVPVAPAEATDGLGAPTALALGPPVVTVKTLYDVLAEEKELAVEANSQPAVTALAQHVRRRWETMRRHRQEQVEPRLLRCLAQRQGKYDARTRHLITAVQGGTDVYMRLSANKARAAASWIRDTLSATDGPLPYSLEPTPEPDLPPERAQAEFEKFMEELQAFAASGAQVPKADLDRLIEARVGMVGNALRDDARSAAARMKRKMDDQLIEGGAAEAFNEFVDDLTTFPYAILKGPVVERKQTLAWAEGAQGAEVAVSERLLPAWKRVSPFDLYWMPHACAPDDGDVIERHRFSRKALSELIGAPGYDEGAIRAALDEYGRGGLVEWISLDADRAAAEGKDPGAIEANDAGLIDALQYWGVVQGKLLLDWGVDAALVPDPLAEYPVEAWLVGQWVVKAVVNADPLGRKPYFKTSYGTIPGSWLGESPLDLVRDCQDVCNAAMRALVNNMGIASGPQVVIDVSRLAPGETPTQMFPWKIYQVSNDMAGATSPPISFFQPPSNAAELLAVYKELSVLADEYSGIPRYMTGDGAAAGAGRTATGMSMMMNNAGKTIKQVIANIDRNVIAPLVERLWYFNMRYADDPELKGDVSVLARGANSLVIKDAAAMRRNELLQLALQSPVAQQVIGMEGIAHMLREQAKTLDLNADKIVPPPEVVAARALVAQMAQQNAPAAPPPVAPGEVLQDGATPVADTFAPSPRP
jgi:hypothetical protein